MGLLRYMFIDANWQCGIEINSVICSFSVSLECRSVSEEGERMFGHDNVLQEAGVTAAS